MLGAQIPAGNMVGIKIAGLVKDCNAVGVVTWDVGATLCFVG